MKKKTFKKALMIFLICLSGIIIVKEFVIGTKLPEIAELHDYCKRNNYSTDYCILVDLSKPTGTNRFYIYDFNKDEIIYKSVCAQGLGKNYNIFKSTFSNEIGSNYSSLGRYKVGNLREMSNRAYSPGYTLYGLDATNSNALARGILIHKGSLPFETFPLPCLPVSKGCFGVSSEMMDRIEKIKQRTNKPLLLYAYK